MRLRYTPQALLDLREIDEYISVELCNPSAANHVISGILESCSKIKDQPGMGISLARKTGRETDLLYIITGMHIAFYKIEENYISVIRILDSRTDYLHVIFGSEK